MPIFEYVCKDCDKKFEAIVIGSNKPECPNCKGQQLEQQLSKFAAHTSSSSPSPSSPCGRPAGGCGGGTCPYN